MAFSRVFFMPLSAEVRQSDINGSSRSARETETTQGTLMSVQPTSSKPAKGFWGGEDTV